MTAVNGSQATIVIEAGVPTAGEAAQVTVGRFMGIIRGTSTIVGLVTEVTEQQTNARSARLSQHCPPRPDRRDRPGPRNFSAASPTIRPSAIRWCWSIDNELRLIYGGADNDRAHVGDLQQDTVDRRQRSY